MSNSHACKGQRSSGPVVVYSNAPLAGARTGPHICPLHSEPPWCGQRSRTARNSPFTLNTPIARPSTVTILRRPGLISSTRATTYFAMPQSYYGTGRGIICQHKLERSERSERPALEIVPDARPIFFWILSKSLSLEPCLPTGL